MQAWAVVVPWTAEERGAEFLATLQAQREVGATAVLAPAGAVVPPGVAALTVDDPRSGAATVAALRWFAEQDAAGLLWCSSSRASLMPGALRRLAQFARDTHAALAYGDYLDRDAAGALAAHPLVDYQAGSIRDDFDFGPLQAYRGDLLRRCDANVYEQLAQRRFGGWYELRLRLSGEGPVLRLPEPLCTLDAAPPTGAGEAHFQYVDPRNRAYQLEMEAIATAHLQRIGAAIAPPAEPLVEAVGAFPVEASVVIPVRNRARTIADAVRSALAQQTDFPFNVLVVDNHSDDGTGAILNELAAEDPRLIRLVPARRDLGIGGCWNEAIYDERCGRYAVQLDSDDLYDGTDVLARIVAEFRRGPYAMVVGSYTIVNFDLQPIPPGLIDHREWTDENGANNALRIAGLGAPRAFHVPTLRVLGFPNVSFGEDYAVALQLTRRYRIGRIYDSLYWCRRWEDNTDHQLPLEVRNRYALYKDRLRSIEIASRSRVV